MAASIWPCGIACSPPRTFSATYAAVKSVRSADGAGEGVDRDLTRQEERQHDRRHEQDRHQRDAADDLDVDGADSTRPRAGRCAGRARAARRTGTTARCRRPPARTSAAVRPRVRVGTGVSGVRADALQKHEGRARDSSHASGQTPSGNRAGAARSTIGQPDERRFDDSAPAARAGPSSGHQDERRQQHLAGREPKASVRVRTARDSRRRQAASTDRTRGSARRATPPRPGTSPIRKSRGWRDDAPARRDEPTAR